MMSIQQIPQFLASQNIDSPRVHPRLAAGISAFVGLITGVAVLLLLDWVLFETNLVSTRLAVGDNGSAGDKLLLARRYRDSEVVYLGDSRVLYGVQPEFVSTECACGPGFNAGFPAADTRLTRVMAGRLLREMSPDIVVIGVSQWDLSDAADIRVWGPAPELVPPWRLLEFGVSLDEPGEIREAIGQTWRLNRYRGELRAAMDPSADRHDSNADRRGFDEYQGRRQLGASDLMHRQQQWFSDFGVQGRRTEAVGELVTELRSRHIGVVLVAPPLYPDFYARVSTEVSEFQTAMDTLARERGAVFEDVSDPQRISLKRDDFRDAVHLGEDGTRTFSRHIGKVIRAHFGSA